MSDTSSEAAKDLFEGAAAAGVTLATTGPLAAGAALVPTIANLVSAAFKRFVQSRTDRYQHHLLHDDRTGDDYSTMIEGELAKDHGKSSEAILRGARAASEAVDDAALASIALLTRELVRERVPHWFHRQALELLTNVSAQELGDLVALLRFVVSCAREGTSVVVVKAAPCHRAKVATVEGYWMGDEEPGGGLPKTGQHPKAEKMTSVYHLAGLLQRAGLTDPAPAPYAGMGGMPEVTVMCFSLEVARALLAVVDPS